MSAVEDYGRHRRAGADGGPPARAYGRAMTAQPSPRRRTAIGGDGLLLVVSLATVATVALECAFIAVASWALLPAIVALLVLMAVGVVRTVGRLIDGGEVAAPRVPEPAATAQPAPVRPATTRPALGL